MKKAKAIAAKGNSAGVKVVSSKTIFKGRVFELKRDHIIEPGGIEAMREVIAHPGSVVVLPVFPGRPDPADPAIPPRGRTVSLGACGRAQRTGRRARRRRAARVAGRNRLLRAEIYTSFSRFILRPGLLGERMDIFLADRA